MRVGVLGTGDVGGRLGSKLVSLGHEVKMGSRTAQNAKAAEWTKGNGSRASAGTFADAAKFGEVVFNCTAGSASLEALKLAGAKNLTGKVLVDVANPLDFSKGMPPTLTVCNTDSLGEQIQRAFPEAKVVKALNTIGNEVMVNPGLVPGEHDTFVCGNDPQAKAKVVEMLRAFGWKSPIDLGDITAARGLEMVLPVWVRLMVTLKTRNFNFKIAR
ncbi:MAG TPA: NAD(P)-binding domain-containing protein [Nitrososphaerales archaeon]|nr:NAD(P)-binding domain-containing protein [Nitrososphaerales archaeon]